MRRGDLAALARIRVDSRKIAPDSGSGEDDAGPRGRCASASVLPSGDQETPCQPSAILRSAPPSAGTM